MTRVIDQPVLVLNKNWQPIAVFDVATALTTVIRDMGQALDTTTYQLHDFGSWSEVEAQDLVRVPTPSGGVPAPEVIVLQEYNQLPARGISFSRRNLYRRDGGACQYCGVKHETLTIDHVLPRSRGGPTSWENCVAACGPCNHRKADRTPEEAGLTLRSVPKRPSWQPTFTVPKDRVRPSWAPFLKKRRA